MAEPDPIGPILPADERHESAGDAARTAGPSGVFTRPRATARLLADRHDQPAAGRAGRRARRWLERRGRDRDRGVRRVLREAERPSPTCTSTVGVAGGREVARACSASSGSARSCAPRRRARRAPPPGSRSRCRRRARARPRERELLADQRDHVRLRDRLAARRSGARRPRTPRPAAPPGRRARAARAPSPRARARPSMPRPRAGARPSTPATQPARGTPKCSSTAGTTSVIRVGDASTPIVSSGTNGVARDERAVAAAAEWWRPPRSASSQPSAAETSSSPAFGFASAARTRSAGVGMLELVRGEVLAAAPRDRLVPLEAERELDRRLAVEAARELGGVDLRAGQEVDLARAVRGRDDDLVLQIREARLEPRDALDLASGRGRRGGSRRSARGTRPARRPRRAARRSTASIRSSATSSRRAGPCACDAKS